MKKLILTGLACIAALSMSIPVFASETRTSHHSANCSESRRCTDAVSYTHLTLPTT